MSEEIMLTEQQQAEVLHKQITGYGEVIYQSLYGMCTAIKQMRDSKLYKALGHSTFESYAQDMLGMTASQTYRYIKIADNLSADFVESTPQIGIQKLYLLAMAPEEARAEITQTVDLESTTVRELREQIAQLTADRDELAADRQREGLRADRLAREAKEKDAQIDQLQKDKSEAQTALEKQTQYREELADENGRMSERISELIARVDELESRPVEVAVQESTAELEKLREELTAAKEDAEYREIMAMCKLARDQVSTLCTRLRGIRSGKGKESLLKYVKEIGLLIGQLM